MDRTTKTRAPIVWACAALALSLAFGCGDDSPSGTDAGSRDAANVPTDAGSSVCGDSVCAPGENQANCAADCGGCESNLDCGTGTSCCPDGNCRADCGGCACDIDFTCTADCACDPECTSECACDTDDSCTPDCACDPECTSECACDTDTSCTPGCACDPECTSDCECNIDDSCSPGCDCDPDCSTECVCDVDPALCDPGCACDERCAGGATYGDRCDCPGSGSLLCNDQTNASICPWTDTSTERLWCFDPGSGGRCEFRCAHSDVGTRGDCPSGYTCAESFLSEAPLLGNHGRCRPI